MSVHTYIACNGCLRMVESHGLGMPEGWFYLSTHSDAVKGEHYCSRTCLAKSEFPLWPDSEFEPIHDQPRYSITPIDSPVADLWDRYGARWACIGEVNNQLLWADNLGIIKWGSDIEDRGPFSTSPPEGLDTTA
jgi:hypothetical protein